MPDWMVLLIPDTTDMMVMIFGCPPLALACYLTVFIRMLKPERRTKLLLWFLAVPIIAFIASFLPVTLGDISITGNVNESMMIYAFAGCTLLATGNLVEFLLPVRSPDKIATIAAILSVPLWYLAWLGAETSAAV